MDLRELGFGDIDHQRFEKANTPYKVYAELLDDKAQAQFADVLHAPFVTYGALMPDAHGGYTMPIGAVCATKDMVVPQFVGFDIGCGMCAYKTDFTKAQIEQNADKIYDLIISRVPIGFNKHKNHQPFKYDLELTPFASSILLSSGLKQLGTLGGGNHFIEIGYGADDRAWIVIHSGSRGFGHKIASHYMLESYLSQNNHEDKLAQRLEVFEERNIKFKEIDPDKYEKAFNKFKHKQMLELNKKLKADKIKGIWGLDVNSKLGKDYILDQDFALNFALENRKQMIDAIHKIINEVLDSDAEFVYQDEERFINRNHNHAEYDEDRGEWIHRKGATHAKKGMRGVIPANMREVHL